VGGGAAHSFNCPSRMAGVHHSDAAVELNSTAIAHKLTTYK